METFDPILQQEELLRKKAIVDAIQQQELAKRGRRSGLLGAALDYFGQDADAAKKAEYEKASKDYSAAYSQNLGEQANTYIDAASGTPDKPANPREAIARAMTSRFPEMQSLGKSMISNLGKPQEIKQHVIDGKLVESIPGQTPRVAGDYATPKPKDNYGPIEVVGKDAQGRPIQGQRNLQTGKIEPIGNSGQTINVSNTNNAQKAGLGEWAKLAGDTVKELSTAARGSVKVLNQLNQVEKLSDTGTFGGPTAATAVWLGQLAKAGGVPMSGDTLKKLQNSETFDNTAAELWLQTMNANGGSRGLVKEESERIAANLPALVQTPQGRKQIIAVMRQAAEQNIADAQAASSQYSEALQTDNPSKFTFGLSNTMLPNASPLDAAPGSVAGQPPGVMSLDEYLKKMRGGK